MTVSQYAMDSAMIKQPFGSKSFLSLFKNLKSDNFIFICDHCITKRENNEASTIKDQILELTKVVKNLAGEIKNMKAENHKMVEPRLSKSNEHIAQWSNTDRVKKMKASLCIRNNGVPVNMEKIQNIVTNNVIQVIKTVVNEKRDVYVNLPSEESRDKITILLGDEVSADNEIKKIKSKMPNISIHNVKDFSTKENFIEKIKRQNPKISVSTKVQNSPISLSLVK